MIWDILGISPTTEEEVIKTAYRTKLVNVNPEDDPEGFKQLRQAYEQACARAQEEKKGKGPLEQWIYEVEQVYADDRLSDVIRQCHPSRSRQPFP